MTTVTIQPGPTEYFICVDGHSGYAERGKDIVCAGVSTLVQTLMVHLPSVTKDVQMIKQDGHVEISCKGADASKACEVISTGFIMLAQSYPEYVRVYYT